MPLATCRTGSRVKLCEAAQVSWVAVDLLIDENLDLPYNMNVAPSSARPIEPPQRPDPATAFKQMDTENKGYLTQQDFSSAVVNISAEGRRLANAPDRPSAEEAFATMDTDADGKLTAAEFEQAAPQQGQSPAGAGGPPPGQGAGGPPPGGGPRSEGADDSNTTYDAADSNQDGTVSLQEQQAYDAAQAEVDTTGSGSASQNTAAALQTYRSVQSA